MLGTDGASSSCYYCGWRRLALSGQRPETQEDQELNPRAVRNLKHPLVQPPTWSINS